MDELAAAKPPEGVESQPLSDRGYGLPFNADTNRLQGEFVRRIDRHLAEKGKRMIGWDEVLDSGLDKQSHAAVMAWRNDAAISCALKLDRDVVASVCPNCYLDYEIPLEVTYAVEPAPAGMPEAQANHVLGVQGNMWGERTPTPSPRRSADLPAFVRAGRNRLDAAHRARFQGFFRPDAAARRTHAALRHFTGSENRPMNSARYLVFVAESCVGSRGSANLQNPT